jgi:hypothetical protein
MKKTQFSFTFRLITFFGLTFFNFFNGFGFSIKFCVFWYPSSLYIKKKYLGPLSTFSKLWNEIRMEWLKNEKCFF